MKKYIFVSLIAAYACVCASAQTLTARSAADEAAKKGEASESVAYIKSVLPSINDPAEKRSLYAFLGALQEQLALFSDARDSYAAAAAIAAADAAGMPARTPEQLVLDAVRCALSTGDSATADSYLNSAVRNSQDETVQARIKLYAQWSSLCGARSEKDTAEPIVMLKAYASLPSMKTVRPSVLLTLWYLTGDETYAGSLKKEFPLSPETGIVTGTVQQLPAPFWYFVPRAAEAKPEIENAGSGASDVKTEIASSPDESVSDDSQKAKKLQMGLFREKANADSLVSTLSSKGFSPYITTEKRASGTTYYIVVVDENEKGSVSDDLRTAGFEFCPIF